jgi:hypothetical protein
VSLWEKMVCRGCTHPRYAHKGGPGNPWRELSGSCTIKRMVDRKAVTCRCEGFEEEPRHEEPEFSIEDWRVINQIHSDFPNIPFTHNELAQILWKWEMRNGPVDRGSEGERRTE